MRLFTSNLRRAIDTALIGLRPLLEQQLDIAVNVLPQLQESCEHADCTPLPLGTNGRIIFGVDAHDTDLDRMNVLKTQTQSLLDAQSGFDAYPAESVGKHSEMDQTSLLNYFRGQYADRLKISLHDSYDDRRRVPAGTLSRASPERLPDLLSSFAQRLGEIFTTLFHGDGAPTSTVVIAGHSRFLREFLFFFRENQTATARDGVKFLTSWDDARIAKECKQLAREETKISNTGVLSFDLEMCVAPECEVPTISLGRCRLSFGEVVARRPPALSMPRSVFSLDVESFFRTYWWVFVIFVIALCLLYADGLVRRGVLDKKHM